MEAADRFHARSRRGDVTTGLVGYHFHRNHRGPGDHPSGTVDGDLEHASLVRSGENRTDAALEHRSPPLDLRGAIVRASVPRSPKRDRSPSKNGARARRDHRLPSVRQASRAHAAGGRRTVCAPPGGSLVTGDVGGSGTRADRWRQGDGDAALIANPRPTLQEIPTVWYQTHSALEGARMLRCRFADPGARRSCLDDTRRVTRGQKNRETCGVTRSRQGLTQLVLRRSGRLDGWRERRAVSARSERALDAARFPAQPADARIGAADGRHLREGIQSLAETQADWIKSRVASRGFFPDGRDAAVRRCSLGLGRTTRPTTTLWMTRPSQCGA